MTCVCTGFTARAERAGSWTCLACGAEAHPLFDHMAASVEWPATLSWAAEARVIFVFSVKGSW